MDSRQETSELPEESEDIFKKNVLDRYMDRPDEKFQNGKFASVNSVYYVEFLWYYHVSTISNEIDWQPVELADDMLEANLAVASHYPPVISLMSSPDKLKCRKVPSVLRCFTPNKNRNYEVYANHLLILFYPFWTELDLKSDNSYTKKFAARDVIETVNRNKSIIDPYCELVDEALLRYNSEVVNNENLFLNNDVLDHDSLENGDVTPCSMNQSGIKDFEITSPLLLQNDEESSESICSLNVKQRQTFGSCFDMGKRKSETENLNQTQGSETI